MLGLGEEEDGRVRQEVHDEVWRRLQEVATAALIGLFMIFFFVFYDC